MTGSIAAADTGATARRPRWLVAGFVVALASLAAGGALLVRQDQVAVDAESHVEHTLQVLQRTLELDARILQMENAHRGWLVRGDPDFVDERDRHHAASLALLADLRARTHDNPGQKARLDELRALVARRHARMRETVALAGGAAAEAGLDRARAHFRGEGAGSLQPLRAVLDEVRGVERTLLGERTRHADERARRLRWLSLGVPAAGLLVLLAAFHALLAQLDRTRRLHADLVAANRALEASVRELDSFSYSVSHDLRAPLRHIDGYARMLAEELGPGLADEPRRFLDQIGTSSRRMGALIDDLLALARLGRKPLDRVDVDMTQLAADAWREITQDSLASVRFVLEPLPATRGDPALLRQVWLNLLSNAVKYSAPRGADALVEVSGRADEETATYLVTDNGVGFDPRYAQKLFGVFQRLHAQDRFEGTGVGLAIVHRIIGRHGGNVFAESETDRGARFGFTLPQREDA